MFYYQLCIYPVECFTISFVSTPWDVLLSALCLPHGMFYYQPCIYPMECFIISFVSTPWNVLLSALYLPHGMFYSQLCIYPMECFTIRFVPHGMFYHQFCIYPMECFTISFVSTPWNVLLSPLYVPHGMFYHQLCFYPMECFTISFVSIPWNVKWFNDALTLLRTRFMLFMMDCAGMFSEVTSAFFSIAVDFYPQVVDVRFLRNHTANWLHSVTSADLRYLL